MNPEKPKTYTAEFRESTVKLANEKLLKIYSKLAEETMEHVVLKKR